MLAPEASSSSPPACLPPTHTPKQNPKAGRQQRGREVTCPPKPRVSTLTICRTDWKLGVRVRWLCRLPLLKPRESVANESLQCSLRIGAAQLSILSPPVYLSDSCKASASQEGTLVLGPPGRSRPFLRWLPHDPAPVRSGLGCKIQKRRGESRRGRKGARTERQVGLVSNLCRL